MKKLFNKEILMTKEDNGDFKNSSKCWIVIMIMLIFGIFSMLRKKLSNLSFIHFFNKNHFINMCIYIYIYIYL